MFTACTAGNILEIGGGAIDAGTEGRDVLVTDIQFAPWLDVVADAQQLPFDDKSFGNIVMMDVLHHLESPRLFFEEAVRLLRPGGRIVMLEPAMTPVARTFYTNFHEEPVDLSVDPLTVRDAIPDRDPYDANQAIPALLFGRELRRFQDMFPDLSLRRMQYLSLFAYPLSGGFKHWSLLPCWLVRPLLLIEARLLPLIGHLMGFRMLVVLERAA